jgi:hypothetical protein
MALVGGKLDGIGNEIVDYLQKLVFIEEQQGRVFENTAAGSGPNRFKDRNLRSQTCWWTPRTQTPPVPGVRLTRGAKRGLQQKEPELFS